MLLFGSAVAWSALLSFVVQPMLGKRLLPWFGGSPSVWTACMLFFQVALLGGYALADAIARRASPRMSPWLGMVLPIAALACLPLGPDAAARPELADAPIVAILTLLGTHALLPYLALTTAAPLLQHGYERATGQSPYRLYAVSNVGSLLGLLGYPVLLEPLLTLDAQQRLWSWGFALFVALMASAALVASRAPAPPPLASTPAEPAAEPASLGSDRPALGRAPLFTWIALACVPSALLLAVTAYITVDVAVVPILWVVPLALYLGTFVVTFGRLAMPRGPLLLALLPVLAMMLGGSFAQGSAPLWQQLASPLAVLVVIGLLLHRELVRLRPRRAGEQSRFYLAIALGGALGGVLVAVVAPLIFDGFYELPLLVIAGCALLLLVVHRDRGDPGRRTHLRLGWLAFGLALPLVVAVVWVQAQDRSRSGVVIEQHRGFFGVLRVTELPDVRLLSHGRIRHGLQFRDPARSGEPAFYFGEPSGVGRALLTHALDRPRRLAVVGLGIGTLAAYARHQDSLQLYELSPEVVDVAQRRFDFLRRARGQVSIHVGDGRLSLERAPPQGFDVLVLDAFASDSIPVHLLTVEAFSIWLRHVRPDGVIAAHVSNRHLAVERVVLGAAARHHLHARLLDSPRDLERGLAHARWALLSRDASALDAIVPAAEAAEPWGSPVVWTDAFSNLLQVLR